MATATLVKAGAHRLRYLIAAEGTTSETVTIGTVGGATPDTLTDSIGSGTIKQISKARADGYGQYAAGAMTQEKARALWLSDWATALAAEGLDPGSVGTGFPPTAISRMTMRTAGAGVENGTVDANVSAGNPIIEATIQGGGQAYLDIEVPGTIGE